MKPPKNSNAIKIFSFDMDEAQMVIVVSKDRENFPVSVHFVLFNLLFS